MSCAYSDKKKYYSEMSGIPHVAITDFIIYYFLVIFLSRSKILNLLKRSVKISLDGFSFALAT